MLVLTFVDVYNGVQFDESYGFCKKKIMRHRTIWDFLQQLLVADSMNSTLLGKA